MKKTLVLLGLAMFALAGCGTLPKQAFNKEQYRHIKKIALIEQPNQEKYYVNIIAHPGASFGLIGGIVAAVDMNAKANKLTAAIDPAETRLQARFIDALAIKLQQAGFVVSRIKKTMVEIPANQEAQQVSGTMAAPQEILDPKSFDGVDAVLLTTIGGGYVAAGAMSDYFPNVSLDVQLQTTDKKIVYEEHMSYGFQYGGPHQSSILAFPDNSLKFANIDSLIKNPEETRQGLLKGITLTTNQIIKDLAPEVLVSTPVVPIKNEIAATEITAIPSVTQAVTQEIK